METSQKLLILDDERVKKIVNSENLHMLIESLLHVNIYSGEEQYEKDLALFTIPQRYVFAIKIYIAEINSNGHFQFYSHLTGIVWEDVLNGFKEIGAKRNVDIINKSVSRMGSKPSKDHKKRREQMGLLNFNNATFLDLDNAYVNSEHSMYELFIRYMRENSYDFFISSGVHV